MNIKFNKYILYYMSNTLKFHIIYLLNYKNTITIARWDLCITRSGSANVNHEVTFYLE